MAAFGTTSVQPAEEVDILSTHDLPGMHFGDGRRVSDLEHQ